MSYFNLKTNEQLTKDGAARLLRAGGIVTNECEETRETEYYSCWNLKGDAKRCERADFAPPSIFDPSWKVRYQGPDPWFAKGLGVITPGVVAQIKEHDDEERWA